MHRQNKSRFDTRQAQCQGPVDNYQTAGYFTGPLLTLHEIWQCQTDSDLLSVRQHRRAIADACMQAISNCTGSDLHWPDWRFCMEVEQRDIDPHEARRLLAIARRFRVID